LFARDGFRRKRKQEVRREYSSHCGLKKGIKQRKLCMGRKTGPKERDINTVSRIEDREREGIKSAVGRRFVGQ
jgi:hypothetical protein